jgi:polyferredoxin
MLLFVVRSRGSIISPPLQIVAVLMCAFGILVPTLPWTLIGIVWAYVIVWTILTDLVKLAFNHFTRSQISAGAPSMKRRRRPKRSSTRITARQRAGPILRVARTAAVRR